MKWIVKQTKSKGYEFTFDIVKGKAVIGQAHYIPKLLRQGYGIRLNDSKFLLQYMPAADARAYIKKATLPGLNSAGTTAAIIVAAMNDVPAIYIEKFMDVFYSGFTNNEAEHYAITLRDELLRENRVKRGTQYARFAFFRTANRLNQYYKTATGQRVAKRVNNGDFPYNVYDANGGIVKPETKKTKKAG